MNYDELAFFNRQLAAMLRENVPLEGALAQLSAGMKSGPLRTEMLQIEQDLARGASLKSALADRRLPEFYKQMLVIGVSGNDLPGMLTMLADYFERTNAIWNRLKGLIVYPFLVVVISLGLTFLVSIIFGRFMMNSEPGALGWDPSLFIACVWIPPAMLAAALGVSLLAISIPGWRAWLRWHTPAFREASLAQLASVMSLLLKNGVPLPEALAMAEGLESGSPARNALAEWRSLVTSGHGKPAHWPASIPPIPAMFFWLVNKGGENLAAGFQKAEEIYSGRAAYRIELALYGALPISILLLGQMVLWQAVPLLEMLTRTMTRLGDMGD